MSDDLFDRESEGEAGTTGDDPLFEPAAGISPPADDALFDRVSDVKLEEETESPAQGNWLKRVITTPLRTAYQFVFGQREVPDEPSAVDDDDREDLSDDFFGPKRD